MNVLVGGGSGFVGQALIKVLKQNGYNVQIISRKAGPDGRISWGMLSKDGLPTNTHAIINLAGASVANSLRRWPGYKAEVYDSRVKTTKLLADAICHASHKPKVFIQASGAGFYPASDTKEYTENSVVDQPNDFFSALCRDWEAAGELPDGAPTRRAIVRTGVVMSRDGGIIQRTILPFYFGMGGPFGNGRQWMPWIHMDDLVGIYLFALQNEKVNGVLNGVSQKPCTNYEWAKAFGQALWRPYFMPMPRFTMDILFGKERANMFYTGQKILPRRVLEYGYKYKYPDIQSAAREFARLF